MQQAYYVDVVDQPAPPSYEREIQHSTNKWRFLKLAGFSYFF